jgi:hypothetical protein
MVRPKPLLALVVAALSLVTAGPAAAAGGKAFFDPTLSLRSAAGRAAGAGNERRYAGTASRSSRTLAASDSGVNGFARKAAPDGVSFDRSPCS